MIHSIAEKNGGLLSIEIGFRLQGEDLQRLRSEVDKGVSEGRRTALLVTLKGFDGWHVPALWTHLCRLAEETEGVSKVALLGENRWHEAMTRLAHPNTPQTVRYFPLRDMDEAQRWLKS